MVVVPLVGSEGTLACFPPYVLLFPPLFKNLPPPTLEWLFFALGALEESRVGFVGLRRVGEEGADLAAGAGALVDGLCGEFL